MPHIIPIDFKTPKQQAEERRAFWDSLMELKTDSRREQSRDGWAVYEIRTVMNEDELRLVGVFETELSADLKIAELESVYQRIVTDNGAIGPRESKLYGQSVDVYFIDDKMCMFGFKAYKVKTRIAR